MKRYHRCVCPWCDGMGGEFVQRMGFLIRVSKCRPCVGTGRLVLTFATKEVGQCQ